MSDTPADLDDLDALVAAAERAEDEWRWADALAAWDEVLAAAEGADAEDEEAALVAAQAETGRGRVLVPLDRAEEAEAADVAAQERFEALGRPALALVCEANRALQAGLSGDTEAALARAEAAVAEIDALGDADDDAVLAAARAQQVVARLLCALDRIDDGTAAFVDARQRFADAGDDLRLARCDGQLAFELAAHGRLEDAEGRADAAAAAFSVLGAEVDQARMELLVARVRAQRGVVADEALEPLRAARQRFEALGLAAFEAESWHLEGMVLAAVGEDDDAIDAFEAAIEKADRAGLAGGAASSQLELGPALARLGHDEEAVKVLAEAREGLAEVGEAVGVARASWGLATVHRDHGRLGDAMRELTNAIGGFEAVGLHAAAAQVRLDGAAVLDAIGHLSEPQDDEAIAASLEWADAARAGFEEHADDRFVALARRTWGTTAGFAGRTEEGLAAIADARGVLLAAGAGWEVAECDGAAARVLGQAGRFGEGVERASSAVEGFQQAGDAVATAGAALLLGQLLVDADQADAGLQVFDQTIDLATEQGLPAVVGAAHNAAAAALDRLGRSEEAAAHRGALGPS